LCFDADGPCRDPSSCKCISDIEATLRVAVEAERADCLGVCLALGTFAAADAIRRRGPEPASITLRAGEGIDWEWDAEGRVVSKDYR